MYLCISVCAINILIIFYEVFKFIKIKISKSNFDSKWSEYNSLKAELIKSLMVLKGEDINDVELLKKYDKHLVS